MTRPTDNNDAFAAALPPLFWLPVELLEEISLFLERQESVPLLTVNSVLHDVFATRIWRDISGINQEVWKAPVSAWKRYGHLVRKLYIKSDCTLVNVAELPGIVSIEIQPSIASCCIFDQQMPLLQHLVIDHTKPHCSDDRDTMMKVVGWILEAEKRNQEADVIWYLDASYDKQWDWLDGFHALITKPERHSFNLWSHTYTLPFKQASKLAPMISLMSFMDVGHDGVNDYFTSMLADNNITFNRLRQVVFALPSSDLQSVAPVPSLLTSRFPVLEHIVLGWLHPSCSNLTNPFFRGSLVSLSSLRLVKCNDECWKNIVISVPNVQNLTLDSCNLRLDALVVAKQIPQLQKLFTRHDNNVELSHDGRCRESNTTITTGQFLKLNTLEVWIDKPQDMDSLTNLYEFMVNHGPNLQIVKIVGDTLTTPLIDAMTISVNPSVKKLYFFSESVTESDFELMLKLFPRLAKFEVDSPKHNMRLLVKVSAQYSQLRISASHSHEHWGTIDCRCDTGYYSDYSDDSDDYDEYDEDYDENGDDDDDYADNSGDDDGDDEDDDDDHHNDEIDNSDD